jgi:hypothetical protein
MKRILIKGLIVFLTFLVGSSVYLFTASKYVGFWKKDSGSRVLFNGKPSSGSLVYRRTDGIRVVQTAEDGEWYLLGENGIVSYCPSFANSSHRLFSVRLPGYLYVWHYGDYPCVGGIMVFDSVPPKVVRPESLEFSSREGARVKVVW